MCTIWPDSRSSLGSYSCISINRMQYLPWHYGNVAVLYNWKNLPSLFHCSLCTPMKHLIHHADNGTTAVRNVRFLTEREKDRKHLPSALCCCFSLCVHCIRSFLVLLMLPSKNESSQCSCKKRSAALPSGLCKSAWPITTRLIWPD